LTGEMPMDYCVLNWDQEDRGACRLIPIRRITMPKVHDYTKMFDLTKIGVANHAKNTPDKPALIMGDRVITYKEMDELTNAMGHVLIDMGIRQGDRLCIQVYNSPEMPLFTAAAGKAACIPISLNYRFKADELAYVVNNSGSSLLIYGQEFEEVVDQARAELENKDLKFIRLGGKSDDMVPELYDLMAKVPTTPPEQQTDGSGVAASIIYTSGTTGRPKGVFRKPKNRLNSILGYAYNFDAEPDDVSLAAGPLYHSAPYAWCTYGVAIGNTVVIMPRFDAEEFLKTVEKHKAVSTFIVPTMANRIVNLPDQVKNKYDISSLKRITVAAEVFPFPLKKKTIEFFGEGKIYEFYGATESGITTIIRPEDQLRKPGSCGKASFGNDIKLFDEKFNEVSQGEVGIFYSKSDFLLDEYYNNPEATAAAYHGDYFTVGDMAYVDEDGFYYIVDRAVDMVISGGINIYPAEIEEVLYTHPAVFDAGIIGARDPDWGEKLIAFVTKKEGAELTEKDVINYVGEKMAGYKKPKEVYFVEELPYLPSGKMLKRVLKEEYKKMHPEE